MTKTGINVFAGFALMLFSETTMSYERCYLEAKSKDTTSCFIATWNVTLHCDGPTTNTSANCKTQSGEEVDCIVKETTLRGPKEVWCELAMPPPSATPVFTVVPRVVRRRLVAPTPTETVTSALTPTKTLREQEDEEVRLRKICSFSFYGFGDDKGAALAKEAVKECRANEALKTEGRKAEISYDAYNLWKDHRNISKRTPPPPGSPVLNCTPTYLGRLECR